MACMKKLISLCRVEIRMQIGRRQSKNLVGVIRGNLGIDVVAMENGRARPSALVLNRCRREECVDACRCATGTEGTACEDSRIETSKFGRCRQNIAA